MTSRRTTATASPIRVTAREERTATSVRRTLDVDGRAVHFDISGGLLPPPVTTLDYAAVAAIFFAMRTGRDLEIAGPVSAPLLRNLEDFQEAWAAWRPDAYRPVAIRADVVPESARRAPSGGVFAASGGVDGTFAILRHHHRDAGLRTVTPVAGLLVHGFDIPLAAGPAFETTRAGVEKLLAGIAVPLAVISTNWKSELCGMWTMEFAAGLAACLHHFAEVADTGVLAADEDYAHLRVPWGSTPITNPMLSGTFRIHTEGAGFTRTERVAYLCRTPEIARSLRVCWEGPLTGRNCGRCEKCVRTKLNFMAAGHAPLCFDTPASALQIFSISARNHVQIDYLVDIVESARQRELKGAWVWAAHVAIARNRWLLPLRPAFRRIRRPFAPLLRLLTRYSRLAADKR